MGSVAKMKGGDAADTGELSAEIRHLRNHLALAKFFIAREAELREGRGSNAEHLRKFLASAS